MATANGKTFTPPQPHPAFSRGRGPPLHKSLAPAALPISEYRMIQDIIAELNARKPSTPIPHVSTEDVDYNWDDYPGVDDCTKYEPDEEDLARAAFIEYPECILKLAQASADFQNPAPPSITPIDLTGSSAHFHTPSITPIGRTTRSRADSTATIDSGFCGSEKSEKSCEFGVR